MRRHFTLSAAALAGAAILLTGCGVVRGNGPRATPTVGQREPILTRTNELTVDQTIAGQQIILPAPAANAEWGQPGGNASKAVGHLALPDALTVAWSAQIRAGSAGARLVTGPVISAGRLFVMDTEGTVHAFDAATGARAWQVTVGDRESDGQRARFGGGVSVDGGTVYAVTGLGDVAALDAATGTQRWLVRPSGPLRGAPTVAFGNVFVMSQDNQLFALRATDGHREWQEAGTSNPGSIFGVAAPAAGQGTVVAGYSTGELIAYRYENGRNVWGDALARTSLSVTVSTLTDIDASPVIDNGRVYAIGRGGRMAGYDLLSGQRLWELNLAGISTPAVAGDWVFVVSDDARLFAVARASGRVRWISQLPRWRDEEDRSGPIRWTGPVLAGNRLMLVSSDGRMASVNPVDGAIHSTTEISGPTLLSPLVANNMLFVMDNSGRITAYR